MLELDDSAVLQLKEAACACTSVDPGIVRAVETHAEEVHVELIERRPLVAIATRQAAVVGTRLHRANHGIGSEGWGPVLSQELRRNHATVEAGIVRYHVLSIGDC